MSIPIISTLIQKKIQKGLGLSKARNIFTGAAPTPVSLIKWFARLGINIQEAYAMTENTCYSHVSLQNKIKIGSVGQALPFCKVKLSEQNEILKSQKEYICENTKIELILPRDQGGSKEKVFLYLR